jgi:hypothetical protein
MFIKMFYTHHCRKASHPPAIFLPFPPKCARYPQ